MKSIRIEMLVRGGFEHAHPFIGACAVLSAVAFAVSPGSAGEIVPFKGYSAGTIVMQKTNERRLYYVT